MTASCDTCTKPGACCQDFVLSGRGGAFMFDADSWWTEANNLMEKHELPFNPLRIDTQSEKCDAEGMVGVRFTCPQVTPEGRCGIYDARPKLCRDYAPGSDKLCVMYVPKHDDDSITKDQL
jgi:Fe-S-cluster containining protein